MSTATLASKSSKVRPVKVAQTHQHADGTIHALSGTDGRSVYVVRLGDAPSCTCPAGKQGRRCYHVATALSRYGAFYRVPWAVIVPATDPDPEPPTPAAPAVIPTRTAKRCQTALYAGCDCERCAAPVAA